ncbi:hypothetical protein QVD17_00108 [Tagetes erecta]|uniref:RNA-directed DNA polymerase, eukaryota, reverse transcriptase zinc-binding domain protein n=1 Tax=Tagetes erecta TaxID=13708 RepID=A0AAD8L2Q4_TARER|nr:hypothetical protein QVD17_00108 [Tagetes erecta]
MGDSNVQASNLAKKVMKIDGNPKVNLLRASSKGNDVSKTNSSSRYPVRGAALDLKMTINPKAMHLQIFFKLDKRKLFCSVVYAANYYVHRRELWASLCRHSLVVKGEPWVMMGDFNSALFSHDSYTGSSSSTIGMREFMECVNQIRMFDVNRSGMHFTWNQKPKQGNGVFKKIDRVMANVRFTDIYPTAGAIFQPNGISDHSPCILRIPEVERSKPPPFKFANFLTHKPEFKVIMSDIWGKNIGGVHQFRVVKRLKLLKTPLRGLLYKQGNLHSKVATFRSQLDQTQRLIDDDPMNQQLIDQESELLASFRVASLDEERFLKQKSKVHWLAEGDANTKYFHNTLKCRNHRARIDVITDSNGILHEGKEVPKAFVDHYVGFLGKEEAVIIPITQELFDVRIDRAMSVDMIREVTFDEIKRTMFAFADDKAPGPDGFTAAFYKKAWEIVGNDICLAVQDFFREGKLLMELNHTGELSSAKVIMNSLIEFAGTELPDFQKSDSAAGSDSGRYTHFGLVGLLLFTFMGHVPGMN